jgi:hypothetical protein
LSCWMASSTARCTSASGPSKKNSHATPTRNPTALPVQDIAQGAKQYL